VTTLPEVRIRTYRRNPSAEATTTRTRTSRGAGCQTRRRCDLPSGGRAVTVPGGRSECQEVGFDTVSKYRLRFVRYPGLLGTESQIDWGRRHYSIDGEPSVDSDEHLMGPRIGYLDRWQRKGPSRSAMTAVRIVTGMGA
jgi:hypothetical protein